ncbi:MULTISPECIES: NAD-dependent epimerase/dehydratase family protein [unclassified Plantactinospora]|uniref:NAD-dependent epimerase/dehydratase family protein n=1 Tax=unclassified Plantactinospora TaxID=2631981 RepID=UPI001F21194E|nr:MULTISPECIES: NAD-dependent epimerase/dehydratase family protein [unclassified Plantactinospora]
MTAAGGGTGSGLRVVVVGATGNVGTSLVEALGRDPAVGTIVGVARRPPRWRPPKTEWAEADIVSADLVEVFDGADVVVHLAWLFQPTHRPLTTWRVNVVGGRRVFAAAARAGVPALVYASSVGAYSPGPKDRPVDESWPTDGWPIAGYTREKAYLERALDAFEHRHPQMRVVRLRPGFIFKRESASQQRRLFTGPLLPGRLVRPGTVPLLPDLPGLRFQALHSADAAEAYRLAVLRDVRGAFNVAAEPVVDGRLLADILRARRVRLPSGPVRAALALAWHLHLVPASPHLLDAVLRVPIMDITRARTELGWTPRHSAREAIEEFLHGLRSTAGMPTAPLTPRLTGGRLAEAGTGVGERP